MQFNNPTSRKDETKNMKTLRSRKSIGRSPLRLGFVLIPLACFALSPPARATCREGCSSNDNTFLGEEALGSNTTGSRKTAVGFNALLVSTITNVSTASGSLAQA